MSLFPEKIYKISMLIHNSDLEKVMDTLSEKGIIHITDVAPKEDIKVKDLDVDILISMIISYEGRLKKILSILKPYEKRAKGIKALLSPPEVRKIKVRKKSIDELFEDTDKNLSNFERYVLEIDTKLKFLDEEKRAKEHLISKLSNIQFLDFDISYAKESNYIALRAGVSRDLDILRRKIEEIGGILDYRPIIGRKEKRWIVVAIFHRPKKEEMDRIWQRYVEEIDIPDIPGKPSEIIDRLKKELKEIEKEIQRLKEELLRISNERMLQILANLEELTIERAKLEARKSFGKTEKVYIIEGWVLKERIKELLSTLDVLTEGRFVYSVSNPSGNSEEPPTHIKTGKITEPFKPLLTLFGLPKYREINPLIFLTFWFPLMFGFMLGDAGYGLIIFFGSLISFFKFSKRSKAIRDWSTIGMFLGFWTIIFGYVSNSFFGDLLPRFFSMDLPRFSVMGITLPIDGLRNPLTFLQLALILGIIHINIGLFLGMYQDLKNNRIKKLICGKSSFIFLQIFGGALIGEYILKIWHLSPTFNIISYVGALVGIILLAIEVKGMVFLDLMGFVGDWLSYARLLALGLATAGMTLAFNIVAELFGDMIHVFVSLIILVIAYLATMGLNSLGAAVHSLRLQYVEFFNRFYEGGGSPFAPLKAKRKYTEMV